MFAGAVFLQHPGHDRLLSAKLRGAEHHRAALQELWPLVSADRPGQRGVLQRCRDIGALKQWTLRQANNDAFKAYRKEYKRRFAWIKAGRITDQQFYDWSERARAEKDKCEQGLISQKELETWLKESK